LKAAEFEEELHGVVEKIKKVILHSYAQATPSKLTQAPSHGKYQNHIEHLQVIGDVIVGAWEKKFGCRI